MTPHPVLINDGKGWRLGRPKEEPKPRKRVVHRRPEPPPLNAEQVKAMMRLGMNTHDIALRWQTTEAVVWNKLARAST